MEIIECGPRIQFGYVPTHLNPADCATRGLSGNEFSTHYWWNGPEFVTKDPNDWPTVMSLFMITFDDDTAIETTSHHISHCDTNSLLNWHKLEKEYSSVYKAKRVTALVLRFIQRCIAKTTAVTRNRITTN
uniref:COesterase domain-containing protein n=1 Tax=Heterorhabditis bacteriophora TaxID=37862 RepID=A0A1I7X091_HETBA